MKRIAFVLMLSLLFFSLVGCSLFENLQQSGQPTVVDNGKGNNDDGTTITRPNGGDENSEPAPADPNGEAGQDAPTVQPTDPANNDDNGQTDAPGEAGQSGGQDEGEQNEQDPVVPQPTLRNIAEPTYDTYHAPATYDEVTMEDLFDLHNHIAIQIEVNEAELRKIEEDNAIGTKPEIYRLAKEITITMDTQDGQHFVWTMGNVGIRQKGNTSREAIFVDGYLNAHNHFKLSFDETFEDESIYGAAFVADNAHPENADREWLGLSGLDFKWDKNDDQTHLREIYATYLYRAAGIIVQHVGLSTVRMNDTSFGLCYLFEPASKSLVKRAMQSDVEYVNMSTWKAEKKGTYGVAGANYGDMYKVSYGYGSGYAYHGADMTIESINGERVGVKTDIYGNDLPAYERKTNKTTAYDDDLLKALVATVNNGSYDAIAQVVDLEYLAIEEAVAFFVGNPDSMRYNYNNYELYIRRTDGKMIIIPIDNDRAFGVGNTWEGGLHFVYDSARTAYDKKDVSGADNRNQLLLKTILSASDNECKCLYTAYLQALCESAWLDAATFAAYYNIARQTYQADAVFNLSNGANVSFADFVALKKESVAASSSEENASETKPAINADNLYVVGTFNNWGDYDSAELSAYKLEKTADPNVYAVRFVVEYNNGADVKIKLNDGFNRYNVNDFTLRGALSDLTLVPKESSFRIEGATIGSVITVRVNVQTLSASITVE